MTGLRRFPIIAIAALLAAGCGAIPGSSTFPSEPAVTETLESTAASASPTQEPTTAPTPKPTSDTPSPEPSAEPEPTSCPTPEEGWSFATLSDEGDLYMALEFDSITPVEGGEPFKWPRAWKQRIPAFYVGGREARFQPSYDDYRPADIVMRELRVVLAMDDGSRHTVDAAFESGEDGANVAVVRMPDVEGSGTIRISLAWRDACYDVTAHTSSRVIIDQPSAIAGCAKGTEGGFDEVRAAFKAPLGVGPIEADLIPAYFHGKVAPLWQIDPMPPYVAFGDESPTISVTPGQAITITESNQAVQLELYIGTGQDIIGFRRAPLLRGLKGGWIHGDEPEAEIVFRSQLVANGDGTYAMTVPNEPGRYGMQVEFTYDSECSYGVAGFVIGVDVA